MHADFCCIEFQMWVATIFHIVLRCTIITANILTQMSTWDSGFYFPNGSPNLTKERIYDNVKNCTFVPKFYVIKQPLEPEGNLHISLHSNISEINFRIYEGKHPDYPNYKFNVNSNVVQKCNDLINCRHQLICEDAKSDNVLSKDTVFLSWKIAQKDTDPILYLLFHYQKHLITCIDSNPLKIGKIVLEGEKPQQVQSVSLFYKYTHTNSYKTSVNFSLNNSSVGIHFTQNKNCFFLINMTCENETVSNATINSTLPKFVATSVFTNNSIVIFHGWQKSMLSNSNPNNLSCSLEIETQLRNNTDTSSNYWAVAFIDKNEQPCKEQEFTTVQPKTESSSTEPPTTKMPQSKENEKKGLDTPALNGTCTWQNNLTELMEHLQILLDTPAPNGIRIWQNSLTELMKYLLMLLDTPAPNGTRVWQNNLTGHMEHRPISFSYTSGPVKKINQTEPEENSGGRLLVLIICVQIISLLTLLFICFYSRSKD